MFYNNRRLHSYLGHMNPNDYERQLVGQKIYRHLKLISAIFSVNGWLLINRHSVSVYKGFAGTVNDLIVTVGGGGGSRTRVREPSALGSTCLVAPIIFNRILPDGRGA